MADITLTEGDVIDVPASTSDAQKVLSPNAGQVGYRGTLYNFGSFTVFFRWNPAAGDTVDLTENAGAHKGFARAGVAIRIPQLAQSFLCQCAGANTSKLQYIGDGGA